MENLNQESDLSLGAGVDEVEFETPDVQPVQDQVETVAAPEPEPTPAPVVSGPKNENYGIDFVLRAAQESEDGSVLDWLDGSGNPMAKATASAIRTYSKNPEEDAARSVLRQLMPAGIDDQMYDAVVPGVVSNYAKTEVLPGSGSVQMWNTLKQAYKAREASNDLLVESAQGFIDTYSESMDMDAFLEGVRSSAGYDERFFDEAKLIEVTDKTRGILDRYKDTIQKFKSYATQRARYEGNKYLNDPDENRKMLAYAMSDGGRAGIGTMRLENIKKEYVDRINGMMNQILDEVAGIEDEQTRRLVAYAMGAGANKSLKDQGLQAGGNPMLAMERSLKDAATAHANSFSAIGSSSRQAKVNNVENLWVRGDGMSDTTLVTSKKGSIDYESVERMGYRPMTQDEREEYTEWARREDNKERFSIAAKKAYYQANPNEAGNVVWDKFVLPVFDQAAILAQASIPYAGWVMLANQYRGMNFAELYEQGYSAHEANTLATISAPIEAVVERVQWKRFAGLANKNNPFTKLMTSAHRGKGKAAMKFAAAWGVEFGIQNVEEGIQDITLPVLKGIYGAFTDERPGSFSEDVAEWIETRPQTAAALVILSGVGAGAAAVRDKQMFSSLLQSPDHLRAFGLDEASVQEIINAPTYNEQFDTFMARSAEMGILNEKQKDRQRAAFDRLSKEYDTAQEMYDNGTFDRIYYEANENGFTVEAEAKPSTETGEARESAEKGPEIAQEQALEPDVEAETEVETDLEAGEGFELDGSGRIVAMERTLEDGSLEFVTYDPNAPLSQRYERTIVKEDGSFEVYAETNPEGFDQEKADAWAEGKNLSNANVDTAGKGFVVKAPDGSIVGRYDTKDRAQKAARIFNRALNQSNRRSLSDMVDWFMQFRQRITDVKISEDTITLADLVRKGVMSGEQAKRLIDAAIKLKVLPRGSNAKNVDVYGTNTTEISNEIARDIVRIYNGANPFTVVEEFGELYIKQALDDQRVTLDEINQWRSDMDLGEFDKMSRTDAVEWFGQMVQANMLQNVRSLPVHLQGAIFAIREYVDGLADIVDRLDEMITSGEIDPRFLQTLDEASGFVEAEESGAATPSEPSSALGPSRATGKPGARRVVLPKNSKQRARKQREARAAGRAAAERIEDFINQENKARNNAIDNVDIAIDNDNKSAIDRFSMPVIRRSMDEIDQSILSSQEYTSNRDRTEGAIKLLNEMGSSANVWAALVSGQWNGRSLDRSEQAALAIVYQSCLLTFANRSRSEKNKSAFNEAAHAIADLVAGWISESGKMMQYYAYYNRVMAQGDLAQVWINREFSRYKAETRKAHSRLINTSDSLKAALKNIESVIDTAIQDDLGEINTQVSRSKIDLEAPIDSVANIMQSQGIAAARAAVRQQLSHLDKKSRDEIIYAAKNEINARRSGKTAGGIFRTDAVKQKSGSADPLVDYRSLEKRGFTVWLNGEKVSWPEFVSDSKSRARVDNINKLDARKLGELGYEVRKGDELIPWADLRHRANPKNVRPEEKILDRIKQHVLDVEKDSSADVMRALDSILGREDLSLTDADIDRYFDEKMNIKGITEAEQARLTKIVDLLKESRDTHFLAEQITKELAAELDKIFKRRGWVDMAQSVYLGSMLMSPQTHILNITESMWEHASTLFRNVFMVNPFETPKRMQLWLGGVVDSVSPAYRDARYIVSGAGPAIPTEQVTKYDSQGNQSTQTSQGVYKNRNRLESSTYSWYDPRAWIQFSTRALKAADFFNFRIAQEASARISAYEMIRSKNKDLSSVDISKEVERILFNSDKQRGDLSFEAEQIWATMSPELRERASIGEMARAKAKEGFIKRYVDSKVFAMRDPKITERSVRMASRVTLNYAPEGPIGVFANWILQGKGAIDNMPEVTASQKAAKAMFVSGVAVTMPFIRIVFNTLDRAIDYQFGAIGALFPETITGSLLNPDKKRKKETWERMDQVKKNIIGMAVAAIVTSLYWPDEDDEKEKLKNGESFIRIHGSGSKSYKEMQRMYPGWRPRSIQFVGKDGSSYWVRYDRSPFFAIMAGVGGVHDIARSKKNEAETSDLIAAYFASAVKMSIEQSPIGSANEMVTSLQSGSTNQVKGLAMNKLSSAVPLGGLGGFVNKLVVSYEQDKSSTGAYLLSRVPFAGLLNRPRLDALGEPMINKDWQEYMGFDLQTNHGKALRQFAIHGYPPRTLDSTKRKFDNPDDFYEFYKEYGFQFRKRLYPKLGILEGKNQEEYRKRVDAISREAEQAALKKFKSKLKDSKK